MTLIVKDSNQQPQNIATAADAAANLVPVHAPASLDGNGVATPVRATNPLPVMNTAGAPAIDGSAAITLGGTVQSLFGGAVPVNGYLVANNSAGTLYVSDVSAPATAGGATIPIAPGSVWFTPTGTSRLDR
jgi:hypothetical protein